MATFAVIENGIVSNVIVAEDLDTAELVTQLKCVEYTEEKSAYIGLKYDDKKNEFVYPKAPVINEE